MVKSRQGKTKQGINILKKVQPRFCLAFSFFILSSIKYSGVNNSYLSKQAPANTVIVAKSIDPVVKSIAAAAAPAHGSAFPFVKLYNVNYLKVKQSYRAI